MSTLALRPDLFEFDLKQPSGSCRCQRDGIQEAALSTEMEDEDLFLKAVSHEWKQDELSELLETEFDEEAWEGEASRNSPALIRWVQQSLNKVLGLRLAVDGKLGPQTRSAIRSFQQKQGLAVDGVVGPKIQAALEKATSGGSPGPATTMPTTPQKLADATFPRFDKNSAKLKDFHLPEIDRVADVIVASWKTDQPIVTVYVKGHASSEGPAQYNIGLGHGRALAVRKALQKALERKQKNLSYKVLILTLSRGAKDPIATNATEEGRSQNRRVEVFLSTKKLLPKKISPPQPIPIPRCNEDLLQAEFTKCGELFNVCKSQFQFFERLFRNCIDNECRTRVRESWKRYLGSCISDLMKCQENAQYKAGCGQWDLSRRS